jgi:hypothetical protein
VAILAHAQVALPPPATAVGPGVTGIPDPCGYRAAALRSSTTENCPSRSSGGREAIRSQSPPTTNKSAAASDRPHAERDPETTSPADYGRLRGIDARRSGPFWTLGVQALLERSTRDWRPSRAQGRLESLLLRDLFRTKWPFPDLHRMTP